MFVCSATYASVSYSAFDELHGLGVDADGAGAVDHSLALDGLGEEGQWRGGLVCENGFLLRHDEGSDKGYSLKCFLYYKLLYCVQLRCF